MKNIVYALSFVFLSLFSQFELAAQSEKSPLLDPDYPNNIDLLENPLSNVDFQVIQGYSGLPNKLQQMGTFEMPSFQAYHLAPNTFNIVENPKHGQPYKMEPNGVDFNGHKFFIRIKEISAEGMAPMPGSSLDKNIFR